MGYVAWTTMKYIKILTVAGFGRLVICLSYFSKLFKHLMKNFNFWIKKKASICKYLQITKKKINFMRSSHIQTAFKARLDSDCDLILEIIKIRFFKPCLKQGSKFRFFPYGVLPMRRISISTARSQMRKILFSYSFWLGYLILQPMYYSLMLKGKKQKKLKHL